MLSPFQGTTASKVWLTTVHSQMYRCYKVSPTLHQTDLRSTNNTGLKFPPWLTPLLFKTRIEWPLMLTATASFPRVFFLTPTIFKATSRFFGSLGYLDGKNWLDIFNNLYSIVDFAVQFYFRCNFSSHERRRLSQASQWRDFPELIKNSFPRIATNEFAAFRTEYRLGQILLFSCLPFWAKAGFRVKLKDFQIKRLFL